MTRNLIFRIKFDVKIMEACTKEILDYTKFDLELCVFYLFIMFRIIFSKFFYDVIITRLDVMTSCCLFVSLSSLCFAILFIPSCWVLHILINSDSRVCLYIVLFFLEISIPAYLKSSIEDGRAVENFCNTLFKCINY
jgi:hypothetical protein